MTSGYKRALKFRQRALKGHKRALKYRKISCNLQNSVESSSSKTKDKIEWHRLSLIYMYFNFNAREDDLSLYSIYSLGPESRDFNFGCWFVTITIILWGVKFTIYWPPKKWERGGANFQIWRLFDFTIMKIVFNKLIIINFSLLQVEMFSYFSTMIYKV